MLNNHKFLKTEIYEYNFLWIWPDRVYLLSCYWAFSHNGPYKTIRSSLEVYIQVIARSNAIFHYSSFLYTHFLEYPVWKLFYRVDPKWVVFHFIVSTDHQYMRNVISRDPSGLTEAAPHFYQHKQLNPIPHWLVTCLFLSKFLLLRITCKHKSNILCRSVHVGRGSSLDATNLFLSSLCHVKRFVHRQVLCCPSTGNPSL